VVDQWAVPAPARDGADSDAARLRAAALGRRAQDPVEAPLAARERLRLKSGVVVERVSHPQTRRGEVIGQVYSFHEVDPTADGSTPAPDTQRGSRAMEAFVAFAIGTTRLDPNGLAGRDTVPSPLPVMPAPGTASQRQAERIDH
jgi:hypothetical protein